ncbi:MAG: alpha/beta hydrolase [Candidatus Woesearchaeota archaeon]
MKVEIRRVTFLNNKKQKLVGYVHLPKTYTKAYVHLHGFPGDCFGSAKEMCQKMAKRGFLGFRFHFHGTCESEGDFSYKTMSQEVRDISYALDFLQKKYAVSQFILFGHSTGAIDAALYAHTDKRITHLILSGAVSDLTHAVTYDFTPAQILQFEKKGHICYHRPGHWVHRKKLMKTFHDEFFTLDIPRSIQKWKKPLLIIHGKQDEAIPVEKDPYELYEYANEPKELVILSRAGHRYSAYYQNKIVDLLCDFEKRKRKK